METCVGSIWALIRDAGWSYESNDDCDSLFSEEGVGVLQFSSVRKDSPISVADLMDLARDGVPDGVGLLEVKIAGFDGVAASFELEDAHWRHWFIAYHDRALFITYNCPLRERGREDEKVNNLLSTLYVRRDAL